MRGPVLLFLVGLCACAARQDAPKKKGVHPVAAQAQFDLNCQRSQLRYMKISDEQWGAVGCGKRARYRRTCTQRLSKRLPGYYDVHDQCRWILDSPVMTQETATEPPAPETPSSGI